MATSTIKRNLSIDSLSSIGDLNNVKYTYMGYVVGATNQPSGSYGNGNLLCNFSITTNTRGYQIYRPYNETKLYFRAYNLDSGMAWTEWKEIAFV